MLRTSLAAALFGLACSLTVSAGAAEEAPPPRPVEGKKPDAPGGKFGAKFGGRLDPEKFKGKIDPEKLEALKEKFKNLDPEKRKELLEKFKGKFKKDGGE